LDSQAELRVTTGFLMAQVASHIKFSFGLFQDHMRQAGEVLHAEVICESNGRSKGCGIVEFSTPEEAQKAITTLTDSELLGRLIFVREDRETSSGTALGFQGQRSDNSSVYVWNLSYDTSWQDLKGKSMK
jgi:RNA recognition motif. (a.k.a. RRM, RBD, or RNP domain)